MKVLIFGNKLVEGDNLVFELISKLCEKFLEIEFIEVDPTEDLQNYGRELRVIDAVIGIKKVKFLVLEKNSDFDRLLINKVYSMHDFDLGYNLKLLKKMDLINSVEIICLPMGGDEGNVDEGEVFNQIQSIIKKWVAQDIQGS